MKVALVYDRVNKWGGAERVLLTLHEMFPEAPLFTSVYNPKTAPWAKVFPKVITSFVQKIPYAKDKHEHFPYLMPLAFESFNFDKYDLVVSVSSEAAKGIITKPKTKHICYCLTPTRYLWSHYDEYFKGSNLKGITLPIVEYLRRWDKVAAQRPDVMVAISSAVQSRIKKYYQRDTKIIYPPLAFLNNSASKTTLIRINRVKEPILDSHFYLMVSRLVPYKRVDLAVNAFNELGNRLVIVGSGSEEKKLKGIAKSNIKFVGQLTDRQLLNYYMEAKALIMTQEEDFGLVSVEAQANGCPVISYEKGGALDTIIGGKTGIFFENQTTGSLIESIKKFDKMRFNKNDMVKNAKKFSKERFKKEFSKLIQKLKV